MKLGIITLAQAYQFAATAYDRAGKPGLAFVDGETIFQDGAAAMAVPIKDLDFE